MQKNHRNWLFFYNRNSASSKSCSSESTVLNNRMLYTWWVTYTLYPNSCVHRNGDAADTSRSRVQYTLPLKEPRVPRKEENNPVEPRDERDEHIMQASCLAVQAGQCQGVQLRSLILVSVSLKPATSSPITSKRKSTSNKFLNHWSSGSREGELTRYYASWPLELKIKQLDV